MARRLTEVMRSQGFPLRHAAASRAIAEILDVNEHSLASRLKASPDARLQAEHPQCAVDGCIAPAHVEVRLFDVYLHHVPEVFDQQDQTCPFLCADHLRVNEEKAQGERRPRGSVIYPYTNRGRAQGFSTYRELNR
jgi:hypothetical protein